VGVFSKRFKERVMRFAFAFLGERFLFLRMTVGEWMFCEEFIVCM